METIRKLRGKWQAQVRRRGMAPRAKSFDQKADAEKWARSLESELDRCGIQTPLKDHQVDSFDWQVNALKSGLPGILNADEQGLGKTLQTIAFLHG